MESAPMRDTALEELENGLACFNYCRPKALNCASLEMVSALRAAMLRWQRSEHIKAVLMSGEGDRAFCSGGDVKALRADLMADAASPRPEEQVFQEYNLLFENHRCTMPIVCLMDGVTMGYGLGLACSARFRVATEMVRVAMPENNIGLFPDVGFSYLAANAMPPGIGRLMAITGCHLLGAHDAIAAGLATHFVPKERLPELVSALRVLDLHRDADEAVRKCLNDFAQVPPCEPSSLSLNTELVESFAKAGTLSEACISLASAASAGGWAADILEGMSRGAPMSQAVAWRLLQSAEGDVAAGVPEPDRTALALERDFATARRLLYRPDFSEGVRVVLVDRGSSAKWEVEQLNMIAEEDVVAATALSPGERTLGIPRKSS